MTATIILCSHNEHKARELSEYLTGWEVTPLSAHEQLPDETGTTFVENARLKVQAGRSLHPDSWVLADDSGIAIDALDGEPGVRSARFAGDDATDDDNNALVLERMAHLHRPEERAAQFVCVLVAVSPDGQELIATGTVAGALATEPQGTSGFGYDPLFVPAGHDRTFGELGSAAKAQLSHRALAARELLSLLQESRGA